MPFECKKYHSCCQAHCCGLVPIPVPIWQRNQHNLQTEVLEKHKVYATGQDNVKQTCILPITDDGLCPFLKEDLSCAIYEDRPKICRQFGDESHWALRCPMQHADGTPRSEEDKIVLTSKIDELLDNHEKRSST